MKKITKKYGFTLSCKSFRSRLLRALLPQLHRKTLANQVSQVSLAHTSHSLRMQAHTKSKDFGSLCNSYGFTLAETLITLTILGVIAAITVPMLINKQMEAANRTKLKKAMAAYEKAFNQMIIDNDIRTNQGIIDEFTCEKVRKYFKIAKNDPDGNSCRFKTSDRVWWDIADIENPFIILDEKYSGNDRADFIEGYATQLEDENGKKLPIYGMVGRFDDKGILRINDKGYEDSIGLNNDYNQKILAKLYSFVNNAEDLDLKYSKPCPNQCDVMGYMGGGSSGCSGCSFDFDLNGMDATAMFDENGNLYKGKITRNNGRTKGILNSDMSYSEMSIYSTGEKEFDYTCSLYDVSNMTCAGTLNEMEYYENGNQKAIIDCKSNCGEGYSFSVSTGVYTSASMDGNQTGTITAFYKTGKPSYKQTKNEDGTYCNIAYETDGVTIKAGYPEGDGCED